MTQKLFGLGLAGSGIVGVLIVAGIMLSMLKIESGLGSFAIAAGIGIGVILGLLGVFSVAKRVAR